MRRVRWFAATVMIGGAAAALASETTTVTYDALGRVVSTAQSGGPRNGRVNSTDYDAAGNRRANAIGTPTPTPPNASSFAISGPASATSEGGNAVFTVTRTGPASGVTTVNFASANGTASAPTDFAAASGTLTFQYWETVRTVSIPILVDASGEAAESFSLQLSSPTGGATITAASATATIAANGAPNQPPVTVADSLSVGVCASATRNVTANDSDPEGNLPLTVTAVGTSTKGEASIVNASTISFLAYGATGPASITYTVADSLGATSTGTLNITITAGPGCN